MLVASVLAAQEVLVAQEVVVAPEYVGGATWWLRRRCLLVAAPEVLTGACSPSSLAGMMSPSPDSRERHQQLQCSRSSESPSLRPGSYLLVVLPYPPPRRLCSWVFQLLSWAAALWRVVHHRSARRKVVCITDNTKPSSYPTLIELPSTHTLCCKPCATQCVEVHTLPPPPSPPPTSPQPSHSLQTPRSSANDPILSMSLPGGWDPHASPHTRRLIPWLNPKPLKP